MVFNKGLIDLLPWMAGLSFKKRTGKDTRHTIYCIIERNKIIQKSWKI
jgi:hypothetical protein